MQNETIPMPEAPARRKLRYISICSGIEAATVAFHPLGWEPLAFAEIETFPSAVLAYHYPQVPNLGDITKYREWPEELLAECDLLVGGPPCQSFSVAGLRNSLTDERGNLTLVYVNLIDHIDNIRRKHGREPIISLYENVPGIFSTRDNAFGCLVGAICGQDAPVETETGKWPTAGVFWGAKRRVGYRTLDAQYFGLAQRRRRCFLLAVPNELVERVGNRVDPAEILSIAESLRGDSPPSREKGQGAAHDLAPSLTSSGRGVERTGESRGQDPVVAVCPTLRAGGNRTGGDRPPGTDVDTCDSLIATTLRARDQSRGVDSYCSDTLITHALRADGFDVSQDGTGRGTPLVPVTAPCLTQNYGKQPDNSDTSKGPMIIPVQPYTLAIRGREDESRFEYRQDGLANAILTPNGGRAGIGVGAIAFSCKDYGADVGETAPTHRAMGHSNSHANAGGQVAIVAFDTTQVTSRGNYSSPKAGDPCHPLASRAHPPVLAAIDIMQVRRITVTEAERLMGVPDGYTLIPYRGKPAADGPRYRSLGNSFAVPCVRWIGWRIDQALNLAARRAAA